MRTVLLWLGAIASSVLCIGVLNFLWIQGLATLAQTPFSPANAKTVIQFMHWHFLSFDAVVLYLFLMRFRDSKLNLNDLAIMHAFMVVLLYIMTSILVAKNPDLGFWYPFLPPVHLFSF